MWPLLAVLLQDISQPSVTMTPINSNWQTYAQPTVTYLEVTNVTNNTIHGFLNASAPGILFGGTSPLDPPCMRNNTACCVRDMSDSLILPGQALLAASACQTGPVSTDLSNPDFQVTIRGNTFKVTTTATLTTLGLLVPSEPAVTLFTLRAASAVDYDRRMVHSGLAQLELDPNRTWARLTMNTRLPDTTIVSILWRTGLGPWQRCNGNTSSTCPDVGPACVGTTGPNNTLQAWVPDVTLDTTVWVTVRSGADMGRVMLRASNLILNTNCAPAVTCKLNARVLIARGLAQTVVWEGLTTDVIDITQASSLDALLTVWTWMNVTNITVTSSQSPITDSCEHCPTETLMQDGQAQDNTTCHFVGSPDDSTWLDSYLGVAGASLKEPILTRQWPAGATMGIWIRPKWQGPYCKMRFSIKIK